MIEYVSHKRARFFIYNSKQLHNLESFSSDAGINVMVINTQAFHARGEDARRMGMGLDDFQSRTGTRTTALVDHIAGIDDFELLAFLVVQKVER